MKLRDSRVGIPCSDQWLGARLRHAPDVIALVLLLDAGTPSDTTAGDRLVALLHEAGYATLELELLSDAELARDGDAAFNVPELANRVLAAREWARHQPELASLPVLLLAHGTASGAAVRAAWKHPAGFAGVVCLGGRPDLAGATPLGSNLVPTRLIVDEDEAELPIVRRAAEEMSALHDLCVTAPGSLPADALALEWLGRWRDRIHGDDEDEDPGTVA